MKDDKHYEYLYTLDSFLKFERKIYQFAGVTFGRPIKLKLLLYFLLVFGFLLIWRFIPILNLVIKWIPIVVLMVIAGVSAWLLADIGTENRNPLKYFKSFLSYQKRRLKRVTYYRGKEIPKPRDFDMSGHTLFNLPSKPIEVNAFTLPYLNEVEVNEPVNEKDLIYVSQYKPIFSEDERLQHQQIMAAQDEPITNATVLPTIEPVMEESSELFELVTLDKEPKIEISQLKNEITFENAVINSHVEEIEEVVIKPSEWLPSLVESIENKVEELESPPVIENISFVEDIDDAPTFEQVHFTPLVRNGAIETQEKIQEVEESIFYLKIGEINKLSANDKETDLKEKQSLIEKLIEKTVEAIEKRKQVKRYKNRKKKG